MRHLYKICNDYNIRICNINIIDEIFEAIMNTLENNIST